MKPGTKAYIAREGGKIASDLIRVVMSRPKKSPAPTEEADEFTPVTTTPVASEKAPPEQKITPTPQEPELTPKETVATACVACSLGHFATTAGMLNEAVRFKGEGFASNVIADRIAKSLQELNALERVDLTPEKIRGAPDWERELAEEALKQSRGLRHRLETLKTIEELEEAAADVEGFYRNLNREWWRLRLAHPALTLDEAKKLAADEAAKEVEARWQSQESNPGEAAPEVSKKVKAIIGDRQGTPAIINVDSPIQHLHKGDKVTVYFSREFELGGLKGAWVKEYDVLLPDGALSLGVPESQFDFVAEPREGIKKED